MGRNKAIKLLAKLTDRHKRRNHLSRTRVTPNAQFEQLISGFSWDEKLYCIIGLKREREKVALV